MASILQHYGGSTWKDLTSNATLNLREGRLQVFNATGATRTLTLDAATKYALGSNLAIVANVGDQTITVRDADSVLVGSLLPGKAGKLSLFDNTTNAGVWRMQEKGLNSVTANPLGTYAFIAGGGGTFPSVWQDLRSYNPQTDTAQLLTPAAPDPARFSTSAASTIGSLGIISGGAVSGVRDQTWELDTNPITWTQKLDRPNQYERGAAATLNSASVTCGGRDGGLGALTRDTFKFENGSPGTWTQMADVPVDRDLHCFTAVSADVAYHHGGRNGSSASLLNYKYEETLDQWTADQDMLVERQYSGGLYLTSTDEVLNLLGFGDSGTLGNGQNMKNFSFDVVTTTWRERTEATALGLAYLLDFASAVIDFLGEKAYVFAGDDDGASSNVRTIYEMAPGAVLDTWSRKSDLDRAFEFAQHQGMALPANP